MPRGRPENLLPNGRPPMHGARSEVILQKLLPGMVEELKAHLEEHGSRWMTPADEPLIDHAAKNLVISNQLWSYLEQRQAIDTHGRPRAAMKLWLTIENVLTRQLSALGCTPLARAELGANLAASKLDVAQAMRYGRPKSERASMPAVVSEAKSE